MQNSILLDFLFKKSRHQNLANQGHPITFILVRTYTENGLLVRLVGRYQGIDLSGNGLYDFFGLEFFIGFLNRSEQFDHVVLGLFFFLGVSNIVVHIGALPVHIVEFFTEIMQHELTARHGSFRVSHDLLK